MDKELNKTNYIVSMRDGSTVEVCCAAAILALGSDVGGYKRIEEKIQCQNRGEIDRCPVRAMRAEARKKTEKRVKEIRLQAGILLEEADRLERKLK